MDSSIFKARRALLCMQTFSTLGFSILYSTLVLYITQGLNLKDQYATSLTASFIAFNYSLHVLGGYIGGRWMSYRTLFISGMLLQAVGSVVLAIPTIMGLHFGVAIFLAGCGLNNICINCMLMQLFDSHDKRRESAFLWNYSGMNCGFFIGFSVSGYFQLHHNFHTLFILSAFGSLFSFILALFNWKYLKDKDTYFINNHNKRFCMAMGFLMVLGLIVALLFLLESARLSNKLICLGALAVAVVFVSLAWKQKNKDSSHKIWAFIILALSSVIFWSLYQMAPMGLTLYFDRNVVPYFLGIKIPPQWLQNINTIVIILGGPLMSWGNARLRKKGFRISIPFQFTTALFLIGCGFLLLPLGIHFADSNGFSSIYWIIGCYFFQSTGELFISPIGYAMVGQLMPSKLQGLGMGAWLMVTGVAAILSNYFSQTALRSGDSQEPLITNPFYSSAFLKLGFSAIVASIIVFFLSKFLHHLIQEKPSVPHVDPAPYNTTPGM